MSTARSFGLNGPFVTGHPFTYALPEIDDLPDLLASPFFCLVPPGTNFIVGVKIQAAPASNLTGEI